MSGSYPDLTYPSGRSPPAKLGEGQKAWSLAGGGEKGLAGGGEKGLASFGICAYVQDFYEFRDCYVRDCYVRDVYVVPSLQVKNVKYIGYEL